MQLTEAKLRKLFPAAREDYIKALVGGEEMLSEHGMLSNPLHLAHFLAQCAAETGGFRVLSESGSYSAERLRQIFPKYFTVAQAKAYARKPRAILSRAYANRLGNGPERTGDGWRYRGRGFLQETGKANYRASGGALEVDLVTDPDRAAYPPLSLAIALNRWTRSGLNEYAAKGANHAAILACSRGINLGSPKSRAQPNGMQHRKDAFELIWTELSGELVHAKVNPLADGILEEGEEGAEVRALQLRLAVLGYAVGEIDGIFGERTEAAVIVFQKREGLNGVLGKWRVEWDAVLDRAQPFENAGRQDVTAKELAGKGDKAVSWLGWMRNAAAGVAAFLGLDQAADQSGVQLPETLTGLRRIVDPLTADLAWLLSNKWVLGVVACIGVYLLSNWAMQRVVKRYKRFEIERVG